ncbi:MAG TPA: sugar ABC transporter permease [Paraburkholderia sp.]|jgi:multiple sugar transport system permease protein|nr:sugar ABC transporter permease [Paraburkholderia sp.]
MSTPVSHPTPAVAPRVRASRGWLARHSVSAADQRSALLLLAPMLAVLFAVAVFPIVYSLWTSLFDIRLTRAHSTFVGLGNYVAIFRDPDFWAAVGRTAAFTVASVAAIMLIATPVALLLNREFRGRRLLSTALLVPWAIPYVVVGLMWKWIYDSGYGALNGLLLQLGLIHHYTVWLGDTHRTLALIVNAFVWKEVPLATILLLVTLKSISPDLYAAARVDGANVLRRFVHVTLPALRPGFMLVTIYEAMTAVRHFDLFFILTEGGPADASHVLAWHIYVETFRKLSFGSGAALAYVLALATFAMAYGVIRLLGRRL